MAAGRARVFAPGRLFPGESVHAQVLGHNFRCRHRRLCAAPRQRTGYARGPQCDPLVLWPTPGLVSVPAASPFRHPALFDPHAHRFVWSARRSWRRPCRPGPSPSLLTFSRPGAALACCNPKSSLRCGRVSGLCDILAPGFGGSYLSLGASRFDLTWCVELFWVVVSMGFGVLRTRVAMNSRTCTSCRWLRSWEMGWTSSK